MASDRKKEVYGEKVKVTGKFVKWQEKINIQENMRMQEE